MPHGGNGKPQFDAQKERWVASGSMSPISSIHLINPMKTILPVIGGRLGTVRRPLGC